MENASEKTVDELVDIFTDYDEVMQRAIKVLSGAPYRKYLQNEEYARWVITEDDQVRVDWLEIGSGYYGDWETENCHATFPVALLRMSAKEFAAWKAEHEAEAKAVEAARQAAAKHQNELHEFAVYQQLKRKYG